MIGLLPDDRQTAADALPLAIELSGMHKGFGFVQVPCTSRSQILIDAAPMGRALLRGVSDLHRDPVSVCRRPSARTIAVVSLTITRWPHLRASGTPSGPVTYTTPRGRGPEHPMTPPEHC
jgi:hypothetical protein